MTIKFYDAENTWIDEIPVIVEGDASGNGTRHLQRQGHRATVIPPIYYLLLSCLQPL